MVLFGDGKAFHWLHSTLVKPEAYQGLSGPCLRRRDDFRSRMWGRSLISRVPYVWSGV